MKSINEEKLIGWSLYFRGYWEETITPELIVDKTTGEVSICTVEGIVLDTLENKMSPIPLVETFGWVVQAYKTKHEMMCAFDRLTKYTSNYYSYLSLSNKHNHIYIGYDKIKYNHNYFTPHV